MQREGRCNAPNTHKEDGDNLGLWVHKQRQLKKKENMLEDLDFKWLLVEQRAPVPSEEWFDLLEEFKKREEHCNVPQSHKENGKNFGRWVNNQRQPKRMEKLDPNRQKMLQEVGPNWAGRYTV